MRDSRNICKTIIQKKISLCYKISWLTNKRKSKIIRFLFGKWFLFHKVTSSLRSILWSKTMKKSKQTNQSNMFHVRGKKFKENTKPYNSKAQQQFWILWIVIKLFSSHVLKLNVKKHININLILKSDEHLSDSTKLYNFEMNEAFSTGIRSTLAFMLSLPVS